MDFNEFQKSLMSLAMATGFTECEVYLSKNENFQVLIQEGKISHYETSSLQGICFRGVWQGQMGYAYSEELRDQTIGFLVKEAIENASILEEENTEFLFWGEDIPEFDGYNEDLNQISINERIESAKKMEHGALYSNDSIGGIDYCVLDFLDENVHITNSMGLSAAYKKNYISAYVCALAQRNGDTKTGSAYYVGNNWAQFTPEELGREAAKKAIEHLGAYSISSGDYHVLLQNNVMANMLEAFCGIFYGENVEKGFSLLTKLHEKIASPKVTIRDDALLLAQPGSVPFDSEGVPCQNKVVIENGRLEMLLHNLKTANTAGVAPTGNGFKPSAKLPVKTACTNFYIVPGAKTQRTLMAQLRDGILITDISGLHAGANSISGDFSLSAEGILIERGQAVRPIEQITIAGNFYTLLKNIEEVGNDLRFLAPSSSGAMGAPTIMVKRLSISGN